MCIYTCKSSPFSWKKLPKYKFWLLKNSLHVTSQNTGYRPGSLYYNQLYLEDWKTKHDGATTSFTVDIILLNLLDGLMFLAAAVPWCHTTDPSRASSNSWCLEKKSIKLVLQSKVVCTCTNLDLKIYQA